MHVEPRLELAPQPDVFVLQRRPLRLDQLVQLDRLGDHRGDDVEQPQAGVEVIRPAGLPIDAQRPDRLALQLDRHAEERDLLAVVAVAGPGPVQESRVLGDVRHDDPLAGLDDPAGDALADLVTAQALGPLAQPVRDLDVDRLGLRVQQRDRPPLQLQVRIERPQDALRGSPPGSAIRRTPWRYRSSNCTSDTKLAFIVCLSTGPPPCVHKTVDCTRAVYNFVSRNAKPAGTAGN